MPEMYYIKAADKVGYYHIKGEVPNVDFHFHDGCEIYFLFSGDLNYFVEKKVYPAKYGDLFITNANEVHTPSFKSDSFYERIYIQFDPSVATLFSSPDFDLLNCFNNRPKGERNRISLISSQIEDILRLFYKIENAARNPANGADILKIAYFIELLVFINRIFMNVQQFEEQSDIPEKLVQLFDYIEDNLDSDLSLETLEQKFYINRFYLSRLFKKSTGINIHGYILLKRISWAKKLLIEGRSVTDACQMSGFNDYSNFIRIFKKTVGVSPGRYRKTCLWGE